ncbi:MAG: hypothetical protein HFG28_11775 [Eubacterium sp.]|nr:hypothetical protein [Eubacterium sp.]
MKMKGLVKRIVGVMVMASMLFSAMPAISVSATEVEKNKTIKTVELDLNDVLNGSTYASASTATKVLTKDYASSRGETGTIYSFGQTVDFSKSIPDGSTIESITIYCTTDVKVTQSKYTTIKNYVIQNLNTGTTATVPFQQTNSPSSKNKTSVFAGEDANTKFLVRIEGKILMQYTGMDGFTVFGGKMIVTYK